ncbi:MAG: hypothetical protein JWN50_692 [Parcubacteria group bacterium]|nr:hypothetical protein [Parcubacteria group bacterium]
MSTQSEVTAAAAHHIVCPNCGLHASIKLADGTESEPYLTKDEGLDVLAALLAEGRMSSEGAEAVKEEILAWSPAVEGRAFGGPDEFADRDLFDTLFGGGVMIVVLGRAPAGGKDAQATGPRIIE